MDVLISELRGGESVELGSKSRWRGFIGEGDGGAKSSVLGDILGRNE